MKSLKTLCFMVVLAVGLFSLWGCPKKAEVTVTPQPQKETAPAAREEKAVQKPEAAVREEPKEERAAPVVAGLQPIYFDFDRSVLRDDAKSVMKANAEWLKANPRVKIRLEGNSDERGTKEYDQALGQRRALGAKKYLTELGVADKRIALISYGKEKPSCTGQNEDCWQKNRRDDLVAE